MTVGQRFDTFLNNLKLTDVQREDGQTKHAGVRSCLNSWYYSLSSGIANSMLAGSWGKNTQTRPPRDIDVIFVLPYEVYQRYELRTGNKQSQLLQEVKSVLAKSYTVTEMKGDGQVVVVPFATYPIEVVPAFKLQNGKYWICDTNDGGKYKVIDPDAEIESIRQADERTKGNARDLIRMMKCWQQECNVPLKSFCIELLVVEFLVSWQYVGNGTTFYDWMVRDFLGFLKGKKNGFVIVPGTYEIMFLGDDWFSRAESAFDRAVKATRYESDDILRILAGPEWQKIFGTYIPQE